MIREKMWVIRPEGTHLSQARSGDGYSPLARDEATNDLETHATLYPITDDDDVVAPDYSAMSVVDEGEYNQVSATDDVYEEFMTYLGAAIVAYAIAQEVAPHVKRWSSKWAVPALRSVRAKVRRRGSAAELATEVESMAVRAPAHMAQPERLGLLAPSTRPACRATRRGTDWPPRWSKGSSARSK